MQKVRRARGMLSLPCYLTLRRQAHVSRSLSYLICTIPADRAAKSRSAGTAEFSREAHDVPWIFDFLAAGLEARPVSSVPIVIFTFFDAGRNAIIVRLIKMVEAQIRAALPPFLSIP